VSSSHAFRRLLNAGSEKAQRTIERRGSFIFKTITIDYHDLKVFELEQAAEESLKNALLALDRAEVPQRKKSSDGRPR
jgi:hypothetical protein